MDKNQKSYIIRIGVIIFVCFIIFSIYAGTRVGADIGEFIYNIRH